MKTHSMNPYEQLDAWIDTHFDAQVQFLQELIRVPTDTPPGNNAPHAERTAELLAAMGLVPEKHPVPEAEVRAAGLQSITNLIVRRQYGTGPTVLLNAHGDVVPPGCRALPIWWCAATMAREKPCCSTPMATWCPPAKAGPMTPMVARLPTATCTAAPLR